MKIYIVTLVLVLYGVVYGQTGVLSGRVTSDEGPVPAVNILLVDTNIGTVTNLEGYYYLDLIPPGEYRVRFSMVGYETRFVDVTIDAGGRSEITIELNETVIEVDEVEVLGRLSRDASDTKTSVIDLDPGDAKILPGAAEDVMRTLQSLPGVLAPNDFSSQLVVRGSTPDQNLIIIDNVEIFNPYRLYGAVSMFNPDAVDDINLITGGFPAKYGDRLSAVLDVSNREGSRSESFTGSLNASIISANLVLEGKNPFDIKGSWMFNSRRTYYDLIIEPFAKSAGLVEENVTFPNFYDFQTKLTFGPFDGHKFILTGIYSADGVDVVSGNERRTPDSVSVNNITKNDVASLSWHYAPQDNMLNQAIFSWYRVSGITGLDSEVLDPSLNRNDFEEFEADTLSPYLLNFKFDSDFSFRKFSFDDKFTLLWDDHVFEAGFGFDLMRTTIKFDFELDPQVEAFLQSNPNIRSSISDLQDIKDYNRYRFYFQNKFAFGDKIFLQPGLRVDYYDILSKYYYAPRLAFSFGLDDVTTLRAVYGHYYQSPGYEKLRDRGVFFDLSAQYTDRLNAEKAVHYVLGIERWLTAEWDLRIEGYYKDFIDIIIPFRTYGSKFYTEQIPGGDPYQPEGWTRPVPVGTDSLTQIPVNGSYGESYGFEVLLAKRNKTPDSQLSGWISYSFAFANRFENSDIIPFRFDQRHTVNLVLDYRIDEVWNVGLRWQYGSGFPFTEPVGVKPRVIMVDTDGDLVPDSPQIATRQSITNPEQKEVIFDIDYGDRRKYNTRKPEYHRLDIRVSADAFFWNMDWTFYLDVINVYNRDNVINYDYYVQDDLTLGKEKTTMFPIIPTLGFSMKF